MSDLFGVSFDIVSSPALKLQDSKTPSGTIQSGWGVAWYPNDDYSASVVKDVTNTTAKKHTRMISRWDNFSSSVFLLKLSGQNQVFSQHNTQPFNKSYGGRDWIFCHRGEINPQTIDEKLNTNDGLFEPLGTSQGEKIFCHLLSKFHENKYKCINDVDGAILLSWLQDINLYGSLDVVLSDGQSIVLYRDAKCTDELYYIRRLPPHSGNLFNSQWFDFELEANHSTNRTALIFSSTQPENMEDWQSLQAGQLLIVRRANIIWNSHSHTQENVSPELATADIQTQSSAQSSPISNETDINSASLKKSIFFPLNVKATVSTEDGKLLQYKTYSIFHETTYEYEKKVDKSTHVLRLQPIDDQVQELIKTTLEISTKCNKALYEDVFGNPGIYLNIDKPYKELKIRSNSIVKIYQTLPDDYSMQIRRASIPLVWMPWQRQMMSPYLLPPELPESQLQELSDYAMSFVERNDYNLYETLNDINTCLHKDFQYVSGSTTIETTPYEVFVNRKGVCQDFANLFICMARLLSIPARYRVGYIYTGGNYDNKEQGDATHAWVETYLPYIGWRGFDPTNGIIAAQDHIRVACGRHYRDATPTSGTIFSKDNIEKLNVNVKVTEISL